jgi:hypothetical protein|tara:strand:- start:99 stop:302 length:204 start_codon:yes stop_codon:yes gene_type:complete
VTFYPSQSGVLHEDHIKIHTKLDGMGSKKETKAKKEQAKDKGPWMGAAAVIGAALTKVADEVAKLLS